MTDAGFGRLGAVSGYRRLWTAATTSAFGGYVTVLATQVVVVEVLDGSATDVGLVNAARWVPYLLLGLVVGVLVDRVRRRPVLVASEATSALLLLALPVLALSGHLTLVALVSVVTVLGLCALIGDAAFQSFVPRVVPRPLLSSAHARMDQADAVAQCSGPALAGGLVTLLSAPVAVVVDAVGSLVSAVLLASVRVDEPHPAPDPLSLRAVGQEAREGLSWVYRHPVLRPLALSTHGWFACSAVAGAVVTPLALRDLGMSSVSLGLALSAAGLGALLGSSASVPLGRRWGAGRVIVTARVGSGAAWVVMGATVLPGPGAGAWTVFAGVQLLLGLSLGAENANELGYRQTATPDRLQGRMNATMRSLNRAVIVVAAPLGGLVGDAAGYPAALVAAGVGCLVVAAASAVSRLGTARLGDLYTQEEHGAAGR